MFPGERDVSFIKQIQSVKAKDEKGSHNEKLKISVCIHAAYVQINQNARWHSAYLLSQRNLAARTSMNLFLALKSASGLVLF